MKIRVTFKTPDVADCLDEQLGPEWSPEGEHNPLHDRAIKVMNKFFRYLEYADIELDLETGEARVVPL